MSIRKKLLTGAGYIVAPKLAFTMRHPRKAAMARAANWAVERVTPTRRKSSFGGTAIKGLGAAAVALPVGLWVGRKVFNERQPHAM